MGVLVFRGSEEDVMSRFIGAAEENGLETIIRICADNPFIQPDYVRHLMNYNEDLSFDYVGFRLNNNQPAIKTHLGFFPERVELKALKSICMTAGSTLISESM
jgi:spore coat polysaccharide biosynthesis protein SpsF (cytidylyltransferase family)